MNTNKYKRIIMNILKDNPVHPNVNELYLMVKHEYPEVGIATIYRNLENMATEGEVLKFNTDEQYDRFDATIKPHYHMICTRCGQVYDIPAEIICGLEESVDAMTGHRIESYKLVFKGICKECLDKDNKKEE